MAMVMERVRLGALFSERQMARERSKQLRNSPNRHTEDIQCFVDVKVAPQHFRR